MGQTSSHDNNLSPEHRKASIALEPSSPDLLAKFKEVALDRKITSTVQLNELLDLSASPDFADQVMRSARLITEEAHISLEPVHRRTSKSCSGDWAIEYADMMLFKYRCEAASKDARVQALLTLTGVDSDDAALVSTVVKVAKACNKPIQDARSAEALQSICSTVWPLLKDPEHRLQGLKQWPGVLDVLGAITAGWPGPRMPHEWLPCLDIGLGHSSKDVLPPAGRMALASLLPPSERQGWKLLFNSDLNGKSFATMCSRVFERGPSLVVVRDKGGAVFGGYASEPWTKQGRFYGSSASFLFSLLPTFRVYFPSGVNDNFQWAGRGFSELPNGIGFGGQIGYFSLLVDDTLDSGMSRSGATFASPCLASSETFQVEAMECWLTGLPENEQEDKGIGTAMDRFAEDKAILELHGKAMHSDGYRRAEPPVE